MFTAYIEGKVISNFAFTHFNAAKHFSTKVHEIESVNAGQPFGNYFEEVSIYCASCVISATASIEALINELFLAPGPLQDAITDFDTFFWGGEEEKRKYFFCKYILKSKGLEREPALAKYKKAVNILGKPSLSKGDDPYKAAETLIGYRNYLIHFKPLWDEDRREDLLEQRLAGLFPTSPCVDAGASFLAMKCMSAGCSSWAVQTVVEFVQYFAGKSNLDPKKLSAFNL